MFKASDGLEVWDGNRKVCRHDRRSRLRGKK
jgi:hypothetical protein